MDKDRGTTIMHFNAPIMHYYDHPTNVYVGKGEYLDAEEVKEVEINLPTILAGSEQIDTTSEIDTPSDIAGLDIDFEEEEDY